MVILRSLPEVLAYAKAHPGIRWWSVVVVWCPPEDITIKVGPVTVSLYQLVSCGNRYFWSAKWMRRTLVDTGAGRW
jgi:hypothetical protein